MGMFYSLYDADGDEWQTKAYGRSLEHFEIGRSPESRGRERSAMTFDEVTAILRTEHRATLYEESGGWTWACSCGKQGDTGTGYPTQGRAAARRDQHLRAARRKIANRQIRTEAGDA